MCIYCGTNKYRKIYEHHYGPIPKEENGRSYEIHHIDGDHNNNVPENLIAVTLQEHYDIHLSQHDYGACWLLGKKLQMDHDLLIEMNKQQSLQRVREGTHHLLGGHIQKISSRKRAKEGTLGFQNPETLKKANYERDRIIQEKISRGEWILQNKEFHKKFATQQLEKGLHPSQKKIECEHCTKLVDSANYKRSHGQNCKIFTGISKKISKHPPRKILTCEGCGKSMDVSNFHRHNHGPNCVK